MGCSIPTVESVFFRVSAPPGGKTSISLFGEQEAAATGPQGPVNKCQQERNKSHVFSVGAEGLGTHYNPYQGKRQQSHIQFGGDDKVEVKSSIKVQPNANKSHVFDAPEPVPAPKPVAQPLKEAAPPKVTAPAVKQKTAAPVKPEPQPAKKPAEPQAKAPSGPAEEAKSNVRTSVHVLAPPGGSSSIVFG